MNTTRHDGERAGKTKHISARVPAALADRFAELAESEYRSVSQELRRLMERHVRENEKAAA